MSSRQKRSNGGYGLRRKIAKKRLDEDFEYYFSKIGTNLETPTSKPMKEQLVMVTEFIEATDKSEMKINECEVKRPRGRPKKISTHQTEEADFTDCALRLMDLKEKRIKRFKPSFLDDSETCKAVDEICSNNDSIMTVACEEEVEHVDSIVKRIKLEAVLAADEITGLQEEEVTSLPEGEKENLPEDGIQLETESEPDEVLDVQVDVHDDINDRMLYEESDGMEKDTALLKMKRKYKSRLSQDAIKKLSQLSPDDKIECNECHKLLKPSSFRQHLRTHSGEKPFGCEVCDARFTRKGDVERHVRIVHNKQKPFKCCRCQRAFGDKKNLRWHLMNHDKKLFYVCEVCGFKFGKREYWENHVRFIHPMPGGLELDDSNIDRIGEDEGEDRLRTLTRTLLGEDESIVDDPSQDCAIAAAAVKSIQKETVIEDVINTDVTLPFITNVSKQEGIKFINVKNLNLANLVKIGRVKTTTGLEPYNRVVNQADGGRIEAVVIQFDGSTADSSALDPVTHVQPRFRQQLAPNLIHVVNPDGVLQIVETQETTDQQSIVIETQDFANTTLSDPGAAAVMDCSTDEIQEQVIEVQNAVTSTGEGDSGTVHFVDSEDNEPSKVISIMLTDDGGAGSDTNNSSVQTLIEALLVAAKGGGQTNDTQST